MARTTKLTQAEVFGVIRALIEAGTAPNGPSIRAALGNRGSPPVLQTFLNDWFRSYGPSLGASADAAGPVPDLTIKAQFQDASARAMAEIDLHKKQRESELRIAEDALILRSTQLDERERVIEGKRDAFEQLAPMLRAQVEQAHQDLSVSQAAEAEARGELADLRQNSAELAAASHAAEQHHLGEIEKLRMQLDTEVVARTRLESELEVARSNHRSEAQAARTEIAGLQRVRTETQTRLETALESIDRLRSEINDQNARHQATEARLGELLASAQAALAVALEQRDDTEKARAALSIEVETSRVLLEAAQRARDAVEEHAAGASRQLDRSLSGLSRLENIETLLEALRLQTANTQSTHSAMPGSSGKPE